MVLSVEEVPDRNADEIVEKAVEESIPAFADMLNTLSAISEFAEDTPLSTASIAIPEEEDDVDLTLKLEELLEEKAVETEAEDEAVAAEETPVEEEDDEDDDSLFDLGETEAEIENTISMLKLSAAQTNSYFDTRENRMAATEQMDGFDDDDEHLDKCSFSSIGNDIFHEYNTYGLEWTDNEYIFYINGIETGRTSFGNGVSTDAEELIVSLEIPEAGITLDRSEKTEFIVDYVKVWQK